MKLTASGYNPRTGGRWLVLAVLVPAQGLMSQSLLRGLVPGGTARIFNTDMAVLEAGDIRKDLPCSVNPRKPQVGFDLRYHTGYEVSVPLHELEGSENLLTMLFRVTRSGRGEPVYFTQRFKVPSVDDGSKGDATLEGGFDVGEGSYHVDWLMRDRSERVCSDSWDVDAALTNKDKPMTLMIAPGVIQASEGEQFKEEPPVLRTLTDSSLNVKVLVNFAPQNANSATLQPFDTGALVSILRSISRDPRIRKFSLCAFNMQEQRVVYRQDLADRIDFPALGGALTGLSLGTVDLKRLTQKHGDTEFLTDLIKRETNTGGHPDALIFAGPKVLLDENVPPDALKQIGDLQYPVFYMNYNLTPQSTPWKDAIGHAVKFFKGYEYTITRPKDLWAAVTEMVSRIVKLKHGSGMPVAATQ